VKHTAEKEQRETREISQAMRKFQGEWAVYAGIVGEERGGATGGTTSQLSATISVTLRTWSIEGNLPNSTDTRRYRALRPVEKRVKEREEIEKARATQATKEWDLKYQGIFALDLNM
jgi:hypothetical protein